MGLARVVRLGWVNLPCSTNRCCEDEDASAEGRREVAKGEAEFVIEATRGEIKVLINREAEPQIKRPAGDDGAGQIK